MRAAAPGRILLAATLACLVVCAAALFARLLQPSLGLTLASDAASGVVRITSTRGSSAHVPAPSVLVTIEASGGAQLRPRPSDLIEEPDFFDTYPEMADFFERQSALAARLEASEVTLGVRVDEGALQEYRVTPTTPRLRDLPGVFWFQIVTACAAFLVSVWVLVLRPGELPVRIFAFMGGAIPIFTVSAAIYSTRELALDGGVFRVLSAVNHAGANLFGCGLVALFLVYPVPLVRPRVMWLVPAIVLPWLALDVARIAPDQNWGSRAPILLEMIAALALGAVQWRATRGDPRGRAGLRWLGVSILAGSSLFVFGVVGSTVLGWFPPISQGYSFGFFLVMHASFAFGLRRHRLFDLDEWAYAVLSWVLAGLALITLDAVLIAVLDANRALSTGVVLLVVGFFYLPARSWLWSRAVSRRTAPEHEIFDAVLQVTFATHPDERARLWRALLAELFDPLESHPTDEPVDHATIGEEGIRLDVPAAGTVPAHRLVYPWRGRGLFGPRHCRLVDNLVELVRHAETRREAFERGVRDERSRIARDMHDDIGARLLSSLYCEDLALTRDAVRQAMGEVRSVVHELTRRRLALGDVIAEIRRETIQRLENANIAVDWPLEQGDAEVVLGHRVYRHVMSILRELTSNVVQHAGARRVRVGIACDGGRLVVTFADDGEGFDPGSVPRGRGLDNIERRTAELGGSVEFSRESGESVTRLDVPVGADPSPFDADP